MCIIWYIKYITYSFPDDKSRSVGNCMLFKINMVEYPYSILAVSLFTSNYFSIIFFDLIFQIQVLVPTCQLSCFGNQKCAVGHKYK